MGARAQAEADIQTRGARLLCGRGGPSTFNESERSVEVVAATEAPVRVFDYQRWEEVDEVLLMSGLNPLPEQVPLLDAHSRGSAVSVLLGSARGFRVDGERLLARAGLSQVEAGEKALTLIREGHLTD
ncbi:MAG: hypothetical protein V1797_17135, partial [Pseudomonadota bacterium]